MGGLGAVKARGSRIERCRSMTEVQPEAARNVVEVDREPVIEVAAIYGVHPKILARLLRGPVKSTRLQPATSPGP